MRNRGKKILLWFFVAVSMLFFLAAWPDSNRLLIDFFGDGFMGSLLKVLGGGSPLVGSLLSLSISALILDYSIGLEGGFSHEFKLSWQNISQPIRVAVFVYALFVTVLNFNYLLGVGLPLVGASVSFLKGLAAALNKVGGGTYLMAHNSVLIICVGALGARGYFKRPSWSRIRGAQQDSVATLIRMRTGLKDPKKIKLLRNAEHMVEVGKLARAAKLFSKLGENYHYRAGKLFREVGHEDLALKSFEHAGDYFRAQQNRKRAGDSYFYGQCWERAGAVFKEMLEKDRMTRDLRRQTIHRLGECLFRMEKYRDAGVLLAKNGFYDRAAASFEKAGMTNEAGHCYAKAGQHEDSSRIYMEGGNQVQAELEKGRGLLKKGSVFNAAQAFENARQFEMAAETYLQAGQKNLAAKNFVRAQNFNRAAELYLELDDNQRALECYSQLGDYTRAAQLAANLGLQDKQAEFYEKAGVFIAAAKSYLMISQAKKAVACMAKLKIETEEEAQECSQMFSILYQQGRIEDAFACAIAVLRGNEVSKVMAPVMFSLGDIKIGLGEIRDATNLFFQVARLCPENPEYIRRAQIMAKKTGREFTLPNVIENTPEIKEVDQAEPPKKDKKKKKREDGQEDTLTLDNETIFDLTQEGKLERYEMIQELGRGGMGFVYKALDKELNRVVALKMLHPDHNKEPRVVLFFKREARAISSLSHPNVVDLYEFGYQKGCFYIVMEYVEGITLNRLRQKHPDYIRRSLLGLWYQVCAGLKYAHDFGILHRDLKPANLMVSKERRVKIMDFGLAKEVSDSSKTLQVWGTPSFMAAELLLGGRASYQSDIYALGATFYLLTTGVVPFSGEDPTRKYVGDGLPIAPIERDRTISPGLSKTILKCLQRDPRGRFQSVQELMMAINDLAKSEAKPA